MANEHSTEIELTKKMLKCGSCKDVFNDENQHPCVLSCLCTLCFVCLQKLIKDKVVICPFCSECHDMDWRTFPRDYTRKDSRALLQILQRRWPRICEMCEGHSPVSHRCKQCEVYICNQCVLIHQRVRKLRHHDLFLLNENQVSNDFLTNNLDKMSAEVFCTEHVTDILQIYCKSCRKPICSVCVVETHQGHIFSSLSKVYNEEKKKACTLHSEVQSVIVTIQNVMECLTVERENIKTHANDQRNSIKATFTTTQDILQKKQQGLEGKIDTFSSQKLKILHGQTESMEILKDSCFEASLFLEHSLLYNNKPAFLEIAQAILLRFNELLNTSFDIHPHTSATSFRCLKTGEMLSFQEVVNQLVSVKNTEGNILQCQFSCASQCFIDKECQLSIMLLSSYGTVISDESVECLVTKDEESNGLIKGKFSSKSKTFNFYWKPNETGIFTLRVYSNTVEIAKKNIKVLEDENKKNNEEISSEYLKSLRSEGIKISSEEAMDKEQELTGCTEIRRGRKMNSSTFALPPWRRYDSWYNIDRYEDLSVRSRFSKYSSREEARERKNSSRVERKDVVGGAKKEEPPPRLENTPPKDPPIIPKWMRVQKPKMTFDKTTAHRVVSISSDGKVFKNTSSGEQVELDPYDSRLRKYKGAICSTGFQYPGRFKYAIKIGIKVKEPLDKSNLVFELGIARKSAIGENLIVEGQKYAWSMIGAHHVDCDAICIHIVHNKHLFYHDVLTSNLRGSSTEITFEFLLDTEFGQWKVFDKELEKKLCVFEAVDCSELLYPVVAGYNPSNVKVRATIVHVD